jgi:hypothetical protein
MDGHVVAQAELVGTLCRKPNGSNFCEILRLLSFPGAH